MRDVRPKWGSQRLREKCGYRIRRDKEIKSNNKDQRIYVVSHSWAVMGKFKRFKGKYATGVRVLQRLRGEMRREYRNGDRSREGLGKNKSRIRGGRGGGGGLRIGEIKRFRGKDGAGIVDLMNYAQESGVEKDGKGIPKLGGGEIGEVGSWEQS